MKITSHEQSKKPHTTSQNTTNPDPRKPKSTMPQQSHNTEQRHQRIPSQPMKLSKNGSLPQSPANIKGSVSATFGADVRSQRGAGSTPHRGRVSTLRHIAQGLCKKPFNWQEALQIGRFGPRRRGVLSEQVRHERRA